MLDRLTAFLARISHRGDLVIAIMMLVAVVMMLIPLPTFLVDILITANIAISVLILLVTFYVTTPLEFSSMPSAILIATLFRLAISITTTRLILLQADAGEVISAFGSFVVGGSIAVGLIIFFIITIAQFIVVAKGAERVAEVAARFTLDALPGKQMSIDAELRSGDIDQAEARRLRQQLERESQLFGAMDGAMKFVKGDVIASMVIIIINLIGGFAVGMLQHGMDLGQAATTYSLLTVGDGLVAQIPALLVAVAAGTIVTRVASADGQGDLGQQLLKQLLRDSRVLALTAVIMIGLSLVPGFPTWVFLSLGAVFGLGAYAIQRKARGAHPTAASTDQPVREPALELASSGGSGKGEAPASTFQVVVRLGAELQDVVADAEFRQRGDVVRHELQADLGIEVPQVGRHVDPALKPRHMRIDLEDAPIFEADIPAGQILFEGDGANLDLLGIAHREGPLIAGLQKTLWVDEDQAAPLKEIGLTALQPMEVVAKWLARALRLYAGHFVGIQETRRLLAGIEASYADLVKEAQEVVPLQKIAEVLRRLVAEDVPIRNLRLILEALIEHGQRDKDAAVLVENVRVALRRQISFRVADRNNIITAYVLQRSAEDILRNAVKTTASGAFLDVSDEQSQALATQVHQDLGQASGDTLPVVLTSMDVRRHMRSLLLHHNIGLPVLSFQDLAPEFNVQPLAVITDRPGQRGEPIAEKARRPLPSDLAAGIRGASF